MSAASCGRFCALSLHPAGKVRVLQHSLEKSLSGKSASRPRPGPGGYGSARGRGRKRADAFPWFWLLPRPGRSPCARVPRRGWNAWKLYLHYSVLGGLGSPAGPGRRQGRMAALRQGDGSELLRRTPGKEDALPVHPLQEASHLFFIAPRVLQHPPGSAPAGGSGSALVLVGSIPSRSWNGPPGRLSPVPASRASMSRARSSAGQEGRTDARSMQGLSRSRGRTSRASARGNAAAECSQDARGRQGIHGLLPGPGRTDKGGT